MIISSDQNVIRTWFCSHNMVYYVSFTGIKLIHVWKIKNNSVHSFPNCIFVLEIILSTSRIFCWKVPSNRSSVETLVIVIIINSWMFYYQFNTPLLMGYICWQIATTRWPLLLNYTQTGNTKIQKKSYHTFWHFKDFPSFPYCNCKLRP